jgi:hypothetical protein
MTASAFFRDAAGRVLLVDPVYKEPWDLPFGQGQETGTS